MGKKNKSAFFIFILITTILPVILSQFFEIKRQFLYTYYWGEFTLLIIFALNYYLKQILIFASISVVSILILDQGNHKVWGDPKISGLFWMLYSGFWIIYFEIGHSRIGQLIRALHPVQHFLYYLTFMFVAIATSFSITTTFFNNWAVLQYLPLKTSLFFVTVASIVPTLTIGALKIVDMIGGKHFLYFLFGTYKRPVEKTEIVLFLDMIGSATISEKLSPKDSMALISQFIFDACAAFRMHGGDVSQYTGDGLVVTWPIYRSKEVLRSIFELRSRITKNREYYNKNFQTIPRFRIGVHAGKLVISQLGEEKLFLGLYGDVVNIAARLEQLNKSLNTRILISDHVVRLLNKSKENDEFSLKSLGVHPIRGQSKEMEVYTLADRRRQT